MKNKIYLLTSYVENTKYLREDHSFEKTYEYNVKDRCNMHPNEYGKIKTSNNYYHILVGNLEYKNCPWCDHEPEMINRISPIREIYREIYLVCPHCHSQGPVLYVRMLIDNDSGTKKWAEQITRQRYSQRIPWEKAANINIDDSMN